MSLCSDEFILIKIIATLRPATSELSSIEELINCGANVLRINFSRGTLDAFSSLLEKVREASKNLWQNIGVLGDFFGPKFLIDKVAHEEVDSKIGHASTRIRSLKENV